MQVSELTNQALEQQIEKINVTLEEIKKNQTEELMIVNKNHNTYMKKLDKLQDYNKIADMTNQLFEKRLLGIENAIREMNKSLGA